MSANQNSNAWAERAPRFVLSTEDGQLLRYSRPGQNEQISKTQIIDFSTTGLAFLANLENAPAVGEIINVELKVLNVEPTMIRYARVVRIEDVIGAGDLNVRVSAEFTVQSPPPPLKLETQKSVERQGYSLVHIFIAIAVTSAFFLIFT